MKIFAACLALLMASPVHGDHYLRGLVVDGVNATNATSANVTNTNTTNTNTTVAPTSVDLVNDNANTSNINVDGVEESVTVATAPTNPPTNPPTSPSPTNPPTNPPTLPIPAPSNDICANAIGPLPITASWSPQGVPEGTTPTAGTTLGATLEGESSSVDMSQCRGSTLQSPGVWYTVMGNGGEITASTCSSNTDFDTQVSVFSGSCAALSCVAHNDDAAAPSCPLNQRASKVTWVSQVGVTYYVLVRGFASTKVGNFELALGGGGSSNYNDECSHSMVVTTLPQQIQADTTKAEIDMKAVLDSACGYDSSDWDWEFSNRYGDRSPKGLWFKVTGTGGRIRATTCDPDGPGLYYGHKIHVLAGSCSGSCVGGTPENTGTCSTYEWDTQSGTDYYVVVHKTYSLGSSEVPGQFAPAPPAPFKLTIGEAGYTNTNVARSEIFD